MGSTPDLGKYNRDIKGYAKAVSEIYAGNHTGVNLDYEYAHWVQNDLNRMLIRLARYKFAAKLLQKSDVVLEVGCGTGLGSIFLSQFSKEVKGIDVKESDIKTAEILNKRPNVSFEVMDFNDETGSYDAIVALDVFEHFPLEIGMEFLTKISRRLNRTGIAIIGSPSVYSFPYQSAISQSSHVKCYDGDELKALGASVFDRCLLFSMNDEVVHMGNTKMSWYYFLIGFYPNAV